MRGLLGARLFEEGIAVTWVRGNANDPDWGDAGRLTADFV